MELMLRPVKLNTLNICMVLVILFTCVHLPVSAEQFASIKSEDKIDCFEKGLLSKKNKPVNCETSAAVIVGSHVILGSDKRIPGASSVFSLKLDKYNIDRNSLQYLRVPAIMEARKIEDFTATPDGKYVIATTAFDRYRTDSGKWDTYNSLLYWPSKSPDKTKIALAQTRDGAVSSSILRRRLANYLNQEYYKIEGLAALPGNKLVFGIRELGRSYKDFDYKILIISTDYHFDSNNELQLGSEFKTLLDYKLPADTKLPKGLGLSSLEYESESGYLYISTTYEHENKHGAYLWRIHTRDLLNNGKPELVLLRDGNPLKLSNKAEGIAFIDSHHLFVIHDDDRLTGGPHDRQHHQAVYSIIKLE